jgi:hypothetical protein
VLTAFVAQSYQSLSPSYPQATLEVLLHVSLQISNSNTSAATSSPPFVPASSDVRVNTYWFLALVLSLAAALFGFLVKQWLHAYLSWTEVLPCRDAVALRQFRYEGMISWQMPGICSSLPILLQVSLVLFLVGLADFLLSLQDTVAAVALSAISLCLLAVVMTMILPTMAPKCPFRSPLSHFVVQCWLEVIYWSAAGYWSLPARLRQVWYHGALAQWSYAHQWRRQWKDRDLHTIRRDSSIEDCSASLRAVHYLWTVCQNETVLKGVLPCLHNITHAGTRSLKLRYCWPLISALVGSPASATRTAALPAGLRSMLAQMSLDAATNECIATKLKHKPLDMLWDAMKAIPLMLLLPTDSKLVQDYVRLLRSAVPLMLDSMGSRDGKTVVQRSQLCLEDIAVGLEFVSHFKGYNWQSIGL